MEYHHTFTFSSSYRSMILLQPKVSEHRRHPFQDFFLLFFHYRLDSTRNRLPFTLHQNTASEPRCSPGAYRCRSLCISASRLRVGRPFDPVATALRPSPANFLPTEWLAFPAPCLSGRCSHLRPPTVWVHPRCVNSVGDLCSQECRDDLCG